MDCVADWSALPAELLGCITIWLTLIEDYNAFRGVCTTWRAAATKFVTKVPLLMLAEKDDDSNEREFYSLARRNSFTRIPLPGAKGKRCINVGYGWIMTLLSSSGEACLLKPFSAERIELPNVKTLPSYKEISRKPGFLFIKGAVLTANPSETVNFTVLVSVFGHYGFWRNGDEKWMNLNPRCITMVYCKEVGKMYTLDFTGHILVWDPQGTDLTKPKEQVKVDNIPTSTSCKSQHYLVESTGGELLIITRNNTWIAKCIPTGLDPFRVMRVDLVKGECIEINDLGKDAIFVGNQAPVSVDATEFPGILKPNCIYFTDDCFLAEFHVQGSDTDMGIYNVETKSIERFDVESYSRVCPPLWVFPSI